MLLFGVADEESWESLSENFRMALMTALMVGEGAFALSFQRGARFEGGGCRWSGCETNLEVSPMGEMGVRSVGLKQQLRCIA